MLEKSNKKVVIGGTFDVLHDGHRALLRKAFSLGEPLIGLTSDRMAGLSRKRKVRGFKERKGDLEEFIRKEFTQKARIVEIDDEFGPTLKEDFDYIVVSLGTYKTAVLINKEREKVGKNAIKIVTIDLVLGKDGLPLSATKLSRSKGAGER